MFQPSVATHISRSPQLARDYLNNFANDWCLNYLIFCQTAEHWSHKCWLFISTCLKWAQTTALCSVKNRCTAIIVAGVSQACWHLAFSKKIKVKFDELHHLCFRFRVEQLSHQNQALSSTLFLCSSVELMGCHCTRISPQVWVTGGRMHI